MKVRIAFQSFQLRPVPKTAFSAVNSLGCIGRHPTRNQIVVLRLKVSTEIISMSGYEVSRRSNKDGILLASSDTHVVELIACTIILMAKVLRYLSPMMFSAYCFAANVFDGRATPARHLSRPLFGPALGVHDGGAARTCGAPPRLRLAPRTLRTRSIMSATNSSLERFSSQSD
ncbi:hypothetical protein EVAR_95380_1 [Eumeta japonica]|uniref:Uncharacterized protein n=1 Tax=Eumeta variegata TaxID=151549 RepID=A0A4C2A075_EUMVA|nr:hypothetical protein EVAR_95380_1 [Eumeta japonica]